MTAKQVRIRRDTATNVNASTPADGELAYDTTNDELRIGDGTTAGGIHIPNSKMVQNQTYTYASAGGTADALTLTLSPVPSAYVAGQRFNFKATATNATTTPTLNVNSLGAKTIKKVTSSGVAAVAAGDIQNGAAYSVMYDGTDMQMLNVPASASTQSYVLLSTKTASSSATLDFTSSISSSYDSYEFIFKDIVSASSNVNLLMRSSENNGSTFITSSYNYQNAVLTLNAATAPSYSGSASGSGTIVAKANGATALINGVIRVTSPLLAASPWGFIEGILQDSAATATQVYAPVGVSAGTGVNAFRFLFSSGNIASGKIYLYGKKNT